MKKKISPLSLKKKLSEASQLILHKNFNEAKILYKDLLKEFPNHPEILNNLSTIFFQEKLFDDGFELTKRSLKNNPYQPSLLNNLAVAMHEAGKNEEALIYSEKAILLNPSYSEAYFNQGVIYQSLKIYDKAMSSYNESTKCNPNNIKALLNKAILFDMLYKFEEALACYDLLLQKVPNAKEFILNKAITLQKLLRSDEAINVINVALKLDNNFIEALYHKHLILHDLKLFDESINCLKKIIEIDNHHHDAKYKLGLIFLRLKRFDEGWSLYEERWATKIINQYQYFKKPKFSSLEVSDIRIYLWSEQGIGDQVIYTSLLPDLLRKQKKIIFSLDARLINLFKRSFEDIEFVSNKEEIDPSLYDAHLSIVDLGGLLRKSQNDFLSQPISFLKPDLTKAEYFKKLLQKDGYLICGLSWKSNNGNVGIAKSIQLSNLLPILKLDNIIFIDLQYGETSDEKNKIKADFNIDIQSVDGLDKFNDIDGLSSLISACDFIITTSNTTAHLAGALGKECSLLLPYSDGSLWYWHEDDKKSLWYPSIDIYRQPKPTDWEKAVNSIKDKIKSKL